MSHSQSPAREMQRRKRIVRDLDKLALHYVVRLTHPGNLDKVMVEISGPKDTPYSGGYFVINISFPPDYPYRSPSVGFLTKVFHPNVDYKSGSICLNTLNQEWRQLITIYDIISNHIPNLLKEPNPNDPLSQEAATLLQSNPKHYIRKVKELVEKNAKLSKIKTLGSCQYHGKCNNNNDIEEYEHPEEEEEEDEEDDSLGLDQLSDSDDDNNNNNQNNTESLDCMSHSVPPPLTLQDIEYSTDNEDISMIKRNKSDPINEINQINQIKKNKNIDKNNKARHKPRLQKLHSWWNDMNHNTMVNNDSDSDNNKTKRMNNNCNRSRASKKTKTVKKTNSKKKIGLAFKYRIPSKKKNKYQRKKLKNKKKSKFKNIENIENSDSALSSENEEIMSNDSLNCMESLLSVDSNGTTEDVLAHMTFPRMHSAMTPSFASHSAMTLSSAHSTPVLFSHRPLSMSSTPLTAMSPISMPTTHNTFSLSIHTPEPRVQRNQISLSSPFPCLSLQSMQNNNNNGNNNELTDTSSLDAEMTDMTDNDNICPLSSLVRCGSQPLICSPFLKNVNINNNNNNNDISMKEHSQQHRIATIHRVYSTNESLTIENKEERNEKENLRSTMDAMNAMNKNTMQTTK